MTFLVVDDEPLVLENTAALLEELGHTVRLAASGPAALAQLDADRSIDLIVTDQMMPGMTGTQMARRAQLVAVQLGAGGHLGRVIIGHAQPLARIEQLRRVGAADVADRGEPGGRAGPVLGPVRPGAGVPQLRTQRQRAGGRAAADVADRRERSAPAPALDVEGRRQPDRLQLDPALTAAGPRPFPRRPRVG